MSSYHISLQQQLLRHFPADSTILCEGQDFSYNELTVKVRSGQYFASMAMTFENLSNDPYVETETLQYILRKFAEEFLYMQDAYQITNR